MTSSCFLPVLGCTVGPSRTSCFLSLKAKLGLAQPLPGTQLSPQTLLPLCWWAPILGPRGREAGLQTYLFREMAGICNCFTEEEKGRALASHWPRPGQTCYFSPFSLSLPKNSPDAFSIAAVRQQRWIRPSIHSSSGYRNTNGGQTIQCDKGPMSPEKGPPALPRTFGGCGYRAKWERVYMLEEIAAPNIRWSLVFTTRSLRVLWLFLQVKYKHF